MLDIPKIEAAIDAFTLTGAEESYTVHIPDREGKPRNYLGLSGLGGECRRATWYDFRKVAKKSFPARMLRLFRRGDIQEYQFVYLLRGIGITVYEKDEDGKQFKVTDFGGHLSGSMDGVLVVPQKFWKKGIKARPILSEYKTYNDKRFNKLRKEKLKKADPKYYTQCQGYMGYNDLDGCLFCAVNKDNDELYFEWIPFDKYAFKRIVALAEDLIHARTAPPKISNDPSWYQCKFCDFHPVCHKGAPSLKSCRSCKFAVPVEDAKWKCLKGEEFGTVCEKYKDIAR